MNKSIAPSPQTSGHYEDDSVVMAGLALKTTWFHNKNNYSK